MASLSPINQHILASSLLATQEALRTTLKELYYLKGPNGPKWLNEFEQKLLSDAKGTVSEGVSMDDELKTVEGTMAMLRFVFLDVRTEIANNAKND
jgi:hypothetical protein